MEEWEADNEPRLLSTSRRNTGAVVWDATGGDDFAGPFETFLLWWELGVIMVNIFGSNWCLFTCACLLLYLLFKIIENYELFIRSSFEK